MCKLIFVVVAGDGYILFLQNDLRKVDNNLTSPALTLTESHCLVFDFYNTAHYWILAEADLKLVMNNTDEILLSLPPTEDLSWRIASVNLPPDGAYNLIWNSKFTSDSWHLMAVDDMTIYRGSCSAVTVETDYAGCSFESNNLCHYRRVTRGAVQWTIWNSNMFPREQSLPQGHVIAINSDEVYGIYDLTPVAIQSPLITVNTSSCLVFNYHNGFHDYRMYDNATLKVFVYGPTNGNFQNITLSKRPSQAWHMVYLDVQPGSFHVYFEALVSEQLNWRAYIALDNIELVPTVCNFTTHVLPACERDEALCGAGTCYNVGFKAYSCVCPPGYYGARCQHMPPCQEKQQCMFGTCLNIGRRAFTCKCRDGFEGELCDNQVTCGIPPEIDNGHVINITSTFLGGVVQYECYENSTLVGLDKLECTGTWETNERSRPICQLIDCGVPPHIRNGVLDFTETYGGAKAAVQCNEGYVSWKFKTVVCTSEKKWVPLGISQPSQMESNTACRLTTNCGEPPAIENGHLVSVSSQHFGGHATYRCHAGFYMQALSHATCAAGESEHFKWVFLPECIIACTPSAPQSMVQFEQLKFVSLEITDCTTNKIRSYLAGKTCDSPFQVMVQAGPPQQDSDDVTFDGNNLCIATRVEYSMYVDGNKMDEFSHMNCVTFCLTESSPMVEVRIAEKIYQTKHDGIKVEVRSRRYIMSRGSSFSSKPEMIIK
jgi:hypothetical protein